MKLLEYGAGPNEAVISARNIMPCSEEADPDRAGTPLQMTLRGELENRQQNFIDRQYGKDDEILQKV